ncbi:MULTISPECIES: aromatic-ring-hydroxylating dioxygenase subunit beta [Sphingomonadales]|jgi:anthranilate 1,2-dioxygenase small subunit|uniref:Anthranilate 1,2-dioxygenase small subunit n=2 Tax=Sphingomonadales TaxID=204457 RepID=A0A917DNE1_9SPHN|nr:MULTISPECIES: aromatic-ring-hydroxylating dioxygenase subunit beta [Sphingomonadales]NYH94913.1 anthranilate 1,2-dioxygenase small subunit [Novosphingobium marinum]PEQ10911.1 anthranilate 1,2-dioxygenase [Novosphingobium sp. PC22D]GGC44037.1 anthranilate 1,2-dioxygenase small subunit [Novosphingobium marinum]GGD53729.1 anthranilate 1,2-dioxygenase small subunit [Croceicoccus pelagius]
MSAAAEVAQVAQSAIDDFNAAYGLCLDDDRLEQWPNLFVDDCLYQVIARENVDNGLPAAVMYCDSRAMLVDRVVALRKANVFPEHFNRHLIGRAVITGVEGDQVSAEASYVVFQTRNDGETRIYNAGKYVDRFDLSGGTVRLKSRTCIYDTLRIATLLATPI